MNDLPSNINQLIDRFPIRPSPEFVKQAIVWSSPVQIHLDRIEFSLRRQIQSISYYV